jgi:hypothetical protein
VQILQSLALIFKLRNCTPDSFPLTGKISHYETFAPQTNPRNPNPWESLKRYDGNGIGHTNKILQKKIETPHMHDPLCPGGIRPSSAWEIPK